MSITDRFWQKVQKSAGCWVWIGAQSHSERSLPYGLFTWDGKLQPAHRVSWKIHSGPIPEGLFVLHKCDNPPCVRPDHLFLGTQSDNLLDCVAKGRYFRTEGEKSGHAKLKAADVLAAREWYAQRARAKDDENSVGNLAAKLGVERKTLSDAIHGKTWKHLPNAQVQLGRYHKRS